MARVPRLWDTSETHTQTFREQGSVLPPSPQEKFSKSTIFFRRWVLGLGWRPIDTCNTLIFNRLIFLKRLRHRPKTQDLKTQVDEDEPQRAQRTQRNEPFCDLCGEIIAFQPKDSSVSSPDARPAGFNCDVISEVFKIAGRMSVTITHDGGE